MNTKIYDKLADKLDDYCDHVGCCDCPYFEAINYDGVDWQSCLDYFLYRGFIPKLKGQDDD